MHWCVADLVSGYDEIILEISFVRPFFQNHLVLCLFSRSADTLCEKTRFRFRLDLDLDFSKINNYN